MKLKTLKTDTEIKTIYVIYKSTFVYFFRIVVSVEIMGKVHRIRAPFFVRAIARNQD